MKKRTKILTVTFGFVAFIIFCNVKFQIYTLNWAVKNSERSFRIMTFNVNSFADTIKFDESFQKELLSLIEREKPDILCFQELSFDNLKRIKPQLDSIYGSCDILKGDNQLWRLRFYSRYKLRNFRKYHCIGQIDSVDFDTNSLLHYHSLQKQLPMMSAEFEVEPGHWITVFSGHLRSSAYSTARKSMDKDASWFEGIPLYKRNYDIGKRIRDYEAENARRYIDEARAHSTESGTNMPVIVAGDLNDWCGSNCLNTLMGDDLKDAWWEGGNGFGWTYFGWHLRLRLDHILYSNELELVDVKVVESDISDHKPLVARFRFSK